MIERVYPGTLVAGGALGLVAMTWQAVERISMLRNPGDALGCNLSPVVECSGVLEDPLAAVFGFPNAFLGMVFFAVLATSGLVLLSGGKFVSWYRHFVMAVSTVLMLFSAWFFAVSLYAIGKICVFCVVGWVVSVPIFWLGLLYFIQTTKPKAGTKTATFLRFGQKHSLDIIVITYIIMLALFLYRFKDFYF